MMMTRDFYAHTGPLAPCIFKGEFFVCVKQTYNRDCFGHFLAWILTPKGLFEIQSHQLRLSFKVVKQCTEIQK